MHYLDHSATTAVIPEAAQAALRAMCDAFGNPSSQHRMGIEAAAELKAARETIASAIGCSGGEIYFTSCGTESTNTALFGAAFKNRHFGKHIVTTAIEHAATLQTCKRLESEGFRVTYLQPDADGHITVEDFQNALEDGTILASVMLVNNELGTMMDVASFGKILKRRCPKALFHIDAVQGFCRVPLTPAKWSCDLMSISGHKIGAPKGIGALYMKKGTNLRPYLVGGGQESGMRSGTEAIPNIAAFAKACEIRMTHLKEDYALVERLNAALRNGISERFPWALVNGAADIPHVLNVSFPGCKSEVMLRVLESDEVYVSAGSACSKGKESHVLKAIGLDKARIDSALRVSFSPTNTEQDVEAFLNAVEKGAKMLKR